MNPLTLLPLLALAAAAPGAHVLAPATTLLTQQHVAHVQVPLTQHVHYESRPVVTGYQSTVIKPALAAAHTPVIAGLSPAFIHARQIDVPADLPTSTPGIPGQPTPAPDNSTSSTTQSPIGDAPVPPIGDLPTNPPVQPPIGGGGENGTGSDNPLPVPGIPLNAQFIQLSNPSVPVSVAAPVALQANDAFVVQARTLPVANVATVRAAQAGDFGPLVTQEKVLAPVRTHTQITPQYTQIQPEIQVRKVIQEVPVATPVAVQTPVIQQWAQAVPQQWTHAVPQQWTQAVPAAANIIHA